MKKILMTLLICFMFLQMTVFAEDEEAVILSEGLEAYDDFLYKNDTRWHFTTDDWTTRNNSYGTYLRNDEGGSLSYVYQPFDYNSGDLRSNYYRFKVKVLAWDNNTRSGFTISDSLTFDNIDNMSIVKNESKYKNNGKSFNKIQIKMKGTDKNVKVDYDMEAYYYYEIEMTRQGITNDFDLVVNIYDVEDDLLASKSKKNVTFSSIYPTLWVGNNNSGYFNEFEAYKGVSAISNISVDYLYQNDDRVYIDWHAVGDAPNEVEVYFSSDKILNDSTDALVNITAGGNTLITEKMQSDGYFLIVGKSDGDFGETTVVEFKYLSPITNFKYISTSEANKYKYTWDAVLGVESFEFKHGSTDWIDFDQLTATIENITSPTSVSIRGHKTSYGNGENTTTATVYAEKGNHSPVQNFDGTIVENSVDLSWSDYPEASSYILYKENDQKSLFEYKTDITTLTYSDTLSDNFLRLGYNIKAVVAGEQSIFTTTISLGNRVKNVVTGFNDTTSQVEVSWDPITAANRYKVFKSASSNMSGATVTEVTTNAFNFAFDKTDKNNKYIQVQAYNLDAENEGDNIYSDKTEVYTIDYSRNNAVTGITPIYTSNASDVKMTWDVLSGAIAYDIWVGSSSSNLQLVARTTDPNYTYRIKNTDVSRLYFAVQGISAENAFVLAQAVPVDTFTKDVVQNLSVNYDGASKIAEVRWSSLFRAHKYKITDGSNTYIVTGDNTVIENVTLGTEFVITAIKEEGTEILSAPSAPVEAIDSDFDVEISRASGVSIKVYGESLEMAVEVDINKLGVNLKDVSLDFNLNNIIEPGTSNVIASYIYPEIISVSVLDAGNVSRDIDYLTTITTGQTVNGIMSASGGFSALIHISDDVDNFIASGSKIIVTVKTDLRFKDLSGGVNSILYINASNAYAQMELPFHIEERIAAFEARLAKGTFIQDAARLDVILSYKTSTNPAEVASTKFQLIDFTFKNKQLIIGE